MGENTFCGHFNYGVARGFGFQEGFGPRSKAEDSGAATSNAALKGEGFFGWRDVQISVRFMITKPLELEQTPNDVLRGLSWEGEGLAAVYSL